MRLAWILIALVACEASPAPEAAPTEPSPKIAKPDCPEAKAPLSGRLATRMADLAEKCDPTRAGMRDATLDATITGHWVGRFEYDERGRTGGSLEVDFIASKGILSGTAVEADGTFPMRANVTGDAYASRQVIWMGTYFSGGTHSVLWVGTLDSVGKRMEGHWRLDRSTGTFFLERK